MAKSTKARGLTNKRAETPAPVVAPVEDAAPVEEAPVEEAVEDAAPVEEAPVSSRSRRR